MYSVEIKGILNKVEKELDYIYRICTNKIIRKLLFERSTTKFVKQI